MSMFGSLLQRVMGLLNLVFCIIPCWQHFCQAGTLGEMSWLNSLLGDQMGTKDCLRMGTGSYISYCHSLLETFYTLLWYINTFTILS